MAEKQTRRALGQSDGNFLAAILNLKLAGRDRRAPLQREIESVFRGIARLKAGLAVNPHSAMSPDLKQTLNEINGFLQTCAEYPHLVPSRGTLLQVFHSVDQTPARGPAGGAICLLMRYGLLDRVRQCQRCSRWFFATRSDNKSCSRKCGAKRTDEAREAKRLYMKEYYVKKNSGKVK